MVHRGEVRATLRLHRYHDSTSSHKSKPLFLSIFGWRTFGCMLGPTLGSFTWKWKVCSDTGPCHVYRANSESR